MTYSKVAYYLPVVATKVILSFLLPIALVDLLRDEARCVTTDKVDFDRADLRASVRSG